MNGLEVCLVIIGLLMIAISFVFSEHFTKNDEQEKLFADGKFSEVAQEVIKKEVETELSMIVDEKLEDAKKEMTKISSEKILAMGEYSEDINLRINKNHEEVMFLYNMLNDKETVVKNTIKDIEALKVSVKKMAIVNDLATDVVEKQSKPVSNQTKQENEIKEKIVSEDIEKVEAHLDAQLAAQSEPQEPIPMEEEVVSKPKSKINVKSSNNNKKILELYNKGLSNIEIAKKLGLGVGEVRLVIDLFNSKK